MEHQAPDETLHVRHEWSVVAQDGQIHQAILGTVQIGRADNIFPNKAW